jgi:phospholipase/carboxylesterase
MPLIIWLHGLGANGRDLMPVADTLRAHLDNNLEIKSIFPDAPIRPITINGGMLMPGWYDITGLTIESREDVPGIQASAEQIRYLIDKQIQLGFNSEEIYLAGFSQGGALAMYAGLTYTRKLAGIIAMSAYLPAAQHLKPVQETDIPIFIGYGENDTVVQPTWSEWMYNWLETANYDSIEAKIYPIEHNISREEIRDISSWLLQQKRQKK